MTGIVRRWTIGPAPDQYNTLALYIEPWASAVSDLDFVMKCRPRALSISGQDPWNFAGTVSVVSGSTTVTGSNDVLFKASMAGAIIRFSDTTTKPTGVNGVNPYVFQEVIDSVDVTGKTLTLKSPSAVSLTGVKYTVSDPVTLDICLYDAFLRNCEKQLSRGDKDYDKIERQCNVALTQAKIADSKTRHTVNAGSRTRIRTRLADYNTNTEVE
jgi:hypothetical protein